MDRTMKSAAALGGVAAVILVLGFYGLSAAQDEAPPPERGQLVAVRINVGAYRELVEMVQELPYRQAAPIIQHLNRSAEPVYAEAAEAPGEGSGEGE